MVESFQPVPKELLDLDLAKVDTSFPVLKGGMYDLIIKESDVVRNGADTGWLWVVKIHTVKDAQDTKGATVKAGACTLFHRVSLELTDSYNHEAIAKNAARLIQAAKPPVTGIAAKDLFPEGPGKAPAIQTKCKAFVGRMLQAKVDALPEGKDKKSGKSLPARNEISQLVKA